MVIFKIKTERIKNKIDNLKIDWTNQPALNVRWFSPQSNIRNDLLINQNIINMDDNDSLSSDEEMDEYQDKIDMDWNINLQNQDKGENLFLGVNKNTAQQPPNNFHKLGTMFTNKTRKISVMEQNKRNSQFQNHQTQLIIENLSPFILNTNIKNQFHHEPLSPDPKYLGDIRPFSPFNVSEFEDGDCKDSKSKDGKKTKDNSRILNQFNNQRKAFSPLMKSNRKTKGKNYICLLEKINKDECTLSKLIS